MLFPEVVYFDCTHTQYTYSGQFHYLAQHKRNKSNKRISSSTPDHAPASISSTGTNILLITNTHADMHVDATRLRSGASASSLTAVSPSPTILQQNYTLPYQIYGPLDPLQCLPAGNGSDANRPSRNGPRALRAPRPKRLAAVCPSRGGKGQRRCSLRISL